MRSIAGLLALFSLAMTFGTRAPAQSVPVTHPRQPTGIVFVCEHGSVKSLVAMKHFNRRAQERGLPYRAVARGTAPERTVPAPVREGLRTDGFDVSSFVPELLKPSDVDHVAFVVSFDDDITETVGGQTQYLKWDDLPGVLSNYPRGREAIVRQIDTLIDALTRGASP